MRSITILTGAFLALAAMSSTALGDTPEAAAVLTTDDVNAWLDGYMPYALHTGDIAGAVVAVVKDGQILTERGYGYSDVAKRAPVDPKLTLFRPGSVSKLITWTAVMQLVEQGKIDLDADVNQLPRLQDSAARRQAGHDAQSHAAHRRIRGAGQGHHVRRTARRYRGSTRSSSGGRPGESTTSARRPPIPTTARRWPATSCSAYPASRSTNTSRSIFSCRST